MASIHIVTDSTCDLGRELIDQHQISVVPLHVVFGTEDYRDGVDLQTKELYETVRVRGVLPKTAAPSPLEFLQVFEPLVRDGGKVLYIGLSSLLSSTCQNARIAAEELPEGSVQIVDSLNLSTGIGLLVMKAVDLLREGERDLDALANRIRLEVPRVETEFVIDTLDYLHKGGRCSGTQKLFGSLLRIHPVVKVVEGRMIMSEKLRGRMDKVIDELLERAVSRLEDMDRSRVFVTHSEAPDYARRLQTQLQERAGLQDVLISSAGCVISSHCGPGTVGILYIRKA